MSQSYHFPITHFLLKLKDLRHCCVLHKGYDNFLDAGSFTKDIKPTEKEYPSLNPPVKPSCEETTQFYQAEDEEKTSFGSSRFHMFNPFSEYTSIFVSFERSETILCLRCMLGKCVLCWGMHKCKSLNLLYAA